MKRVLNNRGMTRRSWLKSTAAILTGTAVSLRWSPSTLDAAPAAKALAIGSRRELFVDRFLIDRLTGAHLELHAPQLAPVMTEPADNLEYGTVIKDGDLFIDTKEYAFDSQNVSFWSESEQRYVCYFRHFLDKRLRSVCRTTSQDFLKWSEPVALRPNFPGEHLYTTLTHPYFRAPHIYVALPTRFHPERGESTDILFMTARGDEPYDRTFREAFIRPGLDTARWGNRANYAALNVVPTGPAEMSIYTTPFRRFVLRTDGFASVQAGADPGEMVTRPLQFSGQELFLNYSTSAAGSVRVEIQDADGQPFPGYALADCRSLVGDTIEQAVTWTKGGTVATLAGRPVRLRFVLQEADLFALQFR